MLRLNKGVPHEADRARWFVEQAIQAGRRNDPTRRQDLAVGDPVG
jgi:hypothetical protein